MTIVVHLLVVGGPHDGLFWPYSSDPAHPISGPDQGEPSLKYDVREVAIPELGKRPFLLYVASWLSDEDVCKRMLKQSRR